MRWGSRWGGLRHAATSLRCSAWGGAAELAALRSAQTAAANQMLMRAARAHPKPALLAAPQVAPPHSACREAGERGELQEVKGPGATIRRPTAQAVTLFRSTDDIGLAAT